VTFSAAGSSYLSTTAPVSREFFLRPAVDVAPDLIGSVFLFSGVGGRIVEVEAYDQDEPSSHSYRGETKRNRSMFGPGGLVYVYRSYGIHWCMNLVCEDDRASAVLIRALEPLEGVSQMVRRRSRTKLRDLCSGPGKLCEALAITSDQDGMSVLGEPFFLGIPHEKSVVVASRRVGISKALELPWRFSEGDNNYVSRPVKD
tara:strand:- start:941 stop:1543 length:603 start_codon:yes stop_codon:yes gene_type:complete